MIQFKEFGKKKSPSVLLVQDFEQSPEEEPITSALLKHYHIIVPVRNHEQTTVEQEADSVERYLCNHGTEKLYAICATSEGWSLIQKILARKSIYSEKVIVGINENALQNLITPMLEEYALEDPLCNQKMREMQ